MQCKEVTVSMIPPRRGWLWTVVNLMNGAVAIIWHEPKYAFYFFKKEKKKNDVFQNTSIFLCMKTLDSKVTNDETLLRPKKTSKSWS